MPTFLVIRNGNVIQNIRGANPPALNAAVQTIAKAVTAEAAKAAPKKDDPKKDEAKSDEAATDETVSGSYGMTKGTGWKVSLS
jgi:thioredoxin 1